MWIFESFLYAILITLLIEKIPAGDKNEAFEFYEGCSYLPKFCLLKLRTLQRQAMTNWPGNC